MVKKKITGIGYGNYVLIVLIGGIVISVSAAIILGDWRAIILMIPLWGLIDNLLWRWIESIGATGIIKVPIFKVNYTEKAKAGGM